jgi:hypothetical protein
MVPDIQKYINDKLNPSHRNQSILKDDSAIVLISNDGMEEESEEESGFAEEQRLMAKDAQPSICQVPPKSN